MSSIILSEYKLSNEYLNILERYPVLNEQEEKLFAIDFYENNNRSAAEKLVLSNLRGVLYIARQYSGYGLPFQDLIQEGVVGLMRAVKRYDPYRGIRLFIYAMPWIKSEIQSYIIQNWKIVKVATTDAKKKLFFNLRKLKAQLLPIDKDSIISISNTLNIDKNVVSSVDNYMSSQNIDIDSEENLLQLADQGNTPEANILELEHNAQVAAVPNVLSMLDDRSRDIIYKRYMSEPQATLSELSEYWNISIERVRQIESKALKNLRSHLPYFKD